MKPKFGPVIKPTDTWGGVPNPNFGDAIKPSDTGVRVLNTIFGSVIEPDMGWGLRTLTSGLLIILLI